MKNELLKRLQALAPDALDARRPGEVKEEATKRQKAAWDGIAEIERLVEIWRRIEPAIAVESQPLLPYQSVRALPLLTEFGDGSGSYAQAKAHAGE